MSFHLSIADNVRSLFDWHTTRHLLNWTDCPDEPCNHLDTEFRKVWAR